jgi:hypothetical protein
MVVSDAAIRLSKLECLRYDDKDGHSEAALDTLVDGLQSNRHLETLEIEVVGSTSGDADLCLLVEAAMGDNPSLKELDLVMNGNLTLQAIANCLAKQGNKLSVLTMWHPRYLGEELADTPPNVILLSSRQGSTT